MAWCPFAVHKPLSENRLQGRITPRAIVNHTAVSNALSLFNFFQNNSDLESHFYVREDGTIEQYMDTGIRADANKNANDFAIAIETWDGGTIRPYTPAQVEALVRLHNWLCDTHAIPRVQIPSAYGAGIGWHVMFGAPGPWTPVAKSCPGGPRIDQVKNIIIPRVAARVLEDTVSWSQMLTGSFDGRTVSYPAEEWLKYADYYAGQAAADSAACKAMLATVLANQQDDVSDGDVLAALNTNMTTELTRIRDEMRQQIEQLRQAAQAARAADREAVVTAVRQVLSEDGSDESAATADAVVLRLVERLAA